MTFGLFLGWMIEGLICAELVESISFDYLYALIEVWITKLHMLQASGKRKKRSPSSATERMLLQYPRWGPSPTLCFFCGRDCPD